MKRLAKRINRGRDAQCRVRPISTPLKPGSSLEVESLAIIAQTGPQSWQARAWMLERMFPDRYGRRMMLSGGGGSAIKITSQRCNKCSRSPHSGWQSCINADCFGHAAFFAV